jgi:hypothetical protein
LAISEFRKEPKESTRKGDSAGGPYRKKLFLRGARECFYVTTRVNSRRWEMRAGKRGLEGISTHFLGIFKGVCGT